MSTIHDEYATDLLRHLGVELVHNLHRRPDGSLTESLHIFCDRKQLVHVQGFIARQHEDLQVVLFEGPRPPF